MEGRKDKGLGVFPVCAFDHLCIFTLDSIAIQLCAVHLVFCILLGNEKNACMLKKRNSFF
jgi:hypothetical protein